MKICRHFPKSVLSAFLLLMLSVVVITPAKAQTVAGELPEVESSGLQFMIEEEKLARDVYLTLDAQWNMRVFQNISRAEQQHMDAVAGLLNQHNLANPTEDQEIGVFADPELQSLYTQLVADGSQSQIAALQVGAAIEEIDILDLQVAMAQTENAATLRVYSSLLQDSSNHLRAFVSNWERQSGETYEPQYMSRTDYDALTFSTRGQSRGDNSSGHRQGNGR